MFTIYLRGKGKFPGKRYMFYENLVGIVLVQVKKQSVVSSSSGSERYFVDKICWWFVNYFYSEKLIY
jgi:hypothetical protein